MVESHAMTAIAGFSLSALEETMQENKRLSTSAAQSAILHRMHVSATIVLCQLPGALMVPRLQLAW